MITTIRDWVTSVLGEYTPVTYLVDRYDSEGTFIGTGQVIADGLAGVDWEYLITAAILLIAIWSVFRLLGVLLQALSGWNR